MKLTRTMVGLKRLDGIRKAPLAFVDSSPNPLPAKIEGKPEQVFEKTTTAIQSGFAQRQKEEARRFAETTKTDYYLVVVFEHGDQATAFLKGVGYPEHDAMYVDGMILADTLHLELPKTPFRLKPLRPVDSALARLVTAPPRRTVK